MSSAWQQALALDARYNAYRTPNNPSFRTLYIRRRSQLLRENAKERDPMVWKQYLRLRSQLLSQRYGVSPSEGALVGDTTIGENYSFTGVHHIFEQHKGPITRLKFANDESARLAIASEDGCLSICHVNEEPNKSMVGSILRGHTKGISDFDWSISNDIIVTVSLDCTVRVWNPTSGECIRIVDDPHPIHSCAFQPMNNNLVVTGNQRGHVQVLNISTGKYVKMAGNKTAGVAICMCAEATGKLLWVGDDRGNIFSFLMDLNSGKLIKGRRMVICAGHPINSVAARAWVSRESRDPLVLIGTSANSLCLYRVAGSDGNLQLRRRFNVASSQLRIRANFCPLMSFRCGACIVSGSEDCCAYLFNIEREGNRFVNKLQGHGDPVLDVCFNHNESFLATGDSKGIVIIWKRS